MFLSGMAESPRQPDVIKKILQHLGLWEESHAPPERSSGQRDYLRSILQSAKLKTSYRNREASALALSPQARVKLT